MVIIAIIVGLLIWIFVMLLAALIGVFPRTFLGFSIAVYILSQNYHALSDACAQQAAVWAWTAIALPAFFAVMFVMYAMRGTLCFGVCPRGSLQLIIPVLLVESGIIALAISGVCIWVMESEACGAHFYKDYTGLYVLFRIVVILGCVEALYFIFGVDTNPEDEDAADEQLRVASAGGNVDEVVRRLDSGASHQSAARGSGNTALHEAAMAGHTEVCRKLILAGASVNYQNTLGHTPLALALAGGHPETVAYLTMVTTNMNANSPAPQHAGAEGSSSRPAEPGGDQAV